MSTKRMSQVGEQIKEILATMLARGQVSDPRVRGVTIQRVRMSPDLQIAKVYFSVLNRSENEALKGLKCATGFLRRKVAEQLRLRVVPEIFFYYDDTVSHIAGISQLLFQVEEDLKKNSDPVSLDSQEESKP